MEILYTTEEVAGILKLNNETVRRLIREEKIKAVKIGHQYRVKQSELELYTGGNLQEDKSSV